MSLYLRQLEAFKQQRPGHTISSKQLGESLRFTNAQVQRIWPTSGSSAIRESDTGWTI